MVLFKIQVFRSMTLRRDIYTHTRTHTHTHTQYVYVCVCVYTECSRRNVPDFGRVFLMLKYTDITQNTYILS